MRGNPGQIIKLKDGRVVIMYNSQPLLKAYQKVVLHLVDENYNWLKDEKGHPKRLIFDNEKYQDQVLGGIKIGMID